MGNLIHEAIKAQHSKSGSITDVKLTRLLYFTTISEAAIMHRMHHDDVVRLYGVVLDTKQIMMVRRGYCNSYRSKKS